MMMYTLSVLNVIFSLASIGHSLECVSCIASVGTHCSGNTITCPDGSICGYIYTEATEANEVSRAFKRSCIEEHRCNTTGSITFANGRVKTAISCCDTENCEPPPPIFPVDDHEENGQVCRSCVTVNSDWCYTSDTVKCTGNETMCVLHTSKLRGPLSLQAAIRGCATRSICDHGRHVINSGGTTVEVEVTCTDGSSSLQQKTFLSGLLILALLTHFQ